MKFLCSAALILLASAVALAQNNPVPFINNPLEPTSVAPGGPGLTVTINGTGFVAGATVYWNHLPLVTNFVSGAQVTATVPAKAIAHAGTASVRVGNPGTVFSNAVPFSVAVPSATVSFVAASQPIATNADDVTTADFNNDGVPDLAITSEAPDFKTGTISVLLGNGDGTFTSSMVLPTPVTNFTITTGDLNGDGHLDLIVGGYYYNDQTGRILVLLGKGDGTFARPVHYQLGQNVIHVGSADITADGNLDVIAITPDGIGVFPGNGDGTLQRPIRTALSLEYGLALGDFNGDGKLDLATGVSNAAGVMIFLGNGDGSFRRPVTFATENEFYNITTGDVNGDGRLDLLACGYSGWVDVLLGNGDGSFGPYTSFPADSFTYQIALADLNRDGNVDAITSDLNFGTLSTLLGNGNGTFQPFTKFSLTSGNAYPTGIALADFNGDGAIDVATADFFTSSVSVVLQQPPGGH